MKVNLICFPYAGGNKNCYFKFAMYNNCNMNLITLDYPGRGGRLNENLLFDIESIVNDACNQVVKYIGDTTYAIYGHSMGALVGYLVAKKIIKTTVPPSHLFFSGRQAPSIDLNENLHQLNRIQLINKLKEFGGSDKAILENEHIMDFYEPIIRADFTAIASYKYELSEKMNVPMTLMFGDNDSITYDSIIGWQNETKRQVNVIKMKGKHFFIFDNAEKIMTTIHDAL